jgi:CubicO group peptidase (beta-lactamase class C family)
MMDVEAGKLMQEDSLFRIYSMTKPIISVAAMILFEEGRLTMNDPVSRFIPRFAELKVETDTGLVEPQEPITLFHLITHTSGLGYHREPFVERSPSLSEAIKQVCQYPLLFQPGSRFSYSSATDVLGYVVQLVAEMPLEDFLLERIFRPLGMKDTSFHVPPHKLQRLAQMYEFEVPGELRIHDDTNLIGDVTLPTNCPSGGAGLVSTLGDYLCFCNCLINSGEYNGGHLLSRKTIAWMTTNHVPRHFMPAVFNPYAYVSGYGMGFWVDSTLEHARSVTSPGQYGWGGAAHTWFWIDPAEHFIGLLMTQIRSEHGHRVTEIFRNLCYQSIFE